MTTYNGARYLQDQLDSFLSQQRLPDEVVICDDGSTDTTHKLLEEFRQRAPFAVHLFYNDTNLGHTRNFEKAMSLCNGDVIFLSDQDDVWDNKKIDVTLDFLKNNPDTDVIINDAFYTDENLNHSGITVLQKVISVGGGKNGHIAGACTALTKRFLRLILPFPQKNCPQHDVYIHRWANLLENKKVLHIPLQVWRIHGLNTTANNEMAQSEIVSPINIYIRSRNLDSKNYYLEKAAEFQEMKILLKTRKEILSDLPVAPEFDKIITKIDQTINAHASRFELMNSGWFRKKQIILQMIINGHYKHFKGFKSIAKDILR